MNFLTSKGIVVLPKTGRIERLSENLHVYDFKISEEDTKRLEGLDKGLRTVDPLHFEEKLGMAKYPMFKWKI